MLEPSAQTAPRSLHPCSIGWFDSLQGSCFPRADFVVVGGAMLFAGNNLTEVALASGRVRNRDVLTNLARRLSAEFSRRGVHCAAASIQAVALGVMQDTRLPVVRSRCYGRSDFRRIFALAGQAAVRTPHNGIRPRWRRSSIGSGRIMMSHSNVWPLPYLLADVRPVR